MNNSQIFTEKTYSILKSLNKSKLLSDERFINLIQSRSNKEIENILRTSFGISEKTFKSLAWYFIDKAGNKAYSLNERQLNFISKLIKKNGLMYRNECNFNGWQFVYDIGELEDMEAVIKIEIRRIYGGKSMYLFHPSIVKEVSQ